MHALQLPGQRMSTPPHEDRELAEHRRWLAAKLIELLKDKTIRGAFDLIDVVLALAGLSKTLQNAVRAEYGPVVDRRDVEAIHDGKPNDAREFLSLLLQRIVGPEDVARILAPLRLMGPLSTIQALCPFDECGKLSVPGTLYCPQHQHEAAVLDARETERKGPIRQCAFRGRNRNGSIGCSIVFRGFVELCPHHRSNDRPPATSGGATIHTLPLSRAPKRSSKGKKR
jgi:hypothetical protein